MFDFSLTRTRTPFLFSPKQCGIEKEFSRFNSDKFSAQMKHSCDVTKGTPVQEQYQAPARPAESEEEKQRRLQLEKEKIEKRNRELLELKIAQENAPLADVPDRPRGVAQRDRQLQRSLPFLILIPQLSSLWFLPLSYDSKSG